MRLFSGNVPSKDLVTQELFTDFATNVEQCGYTMTQSHRSQLRRELEKVNLDLNTDTQSVSMGDFWMGNVLINLDNNDRIREVFVIDWEFVNMAPTWLDVGNFIGEAFLIGYFESTDDAYIHVLESFIEAYRDHGVLLDASRALQFAGAHTMMSLSRRIISPRSKATLETANSYVDTALKFITDPEFCYLQEKHEDPLMALVSLLKQHRKAAPASVN
ncbi:hypothetical protein AA0116_g8468 [Alternaria tenuissima]|nr:hypothetical protein AA0116_g8468 [Alternaria tenuissima]